MPSRAEILLNSSADVRDTYLIPESELNEIPLLKKIYRYLVLFHFDLEAQSPEKYFETDELKTIIETLKSCYGRNPTDHASIQFKTAFEEGNTEYSKNMSIFGHVNRMFVKSTLVSAFNWGERQVLKKDDFTTGEIKSLDFVFYMVSNKVFGTENVGSEFIENVIMGQNNENYSYINLPEFKLMTELQQEEYTPILKHDKQLAILNSLFCDLGARVIARKNKLSGMVYRDVARQEIPSDMNFYKKTDGGKRTTKSKKFNKKHARKTRAK